MSVELVEGILDLSIQNQSEIKEEEDCTAVAAVGENDIDIDIDLEGCASATNTCSPNNNHHGFCAICFNKIELQETALVKGCEHAYCVTCILRWASYKKEPTCPQCKNPFEFLTIHRALDGSIHDYMFEESVCLLLRASWFKPLVVVEKEEVYDDMEEYYYEDEDEDLNEAYLGSSLSLRIGNRRWGDNGYVRGGRQEARPVHRQESNVGPSRQPKKKEGTSAAGASPSAKELVGRRAKRALKREAADKAAAAKHQQHLARLGRT